MSRKLVWKSPDDLRPHPLNKELYGPPTANEQYPNIRFAMSRGGYDERHPLLVTSDNRIISGVTRWAAARSLGLDKVPCELFVPSDPATAELEIEAKLVTENGYRVKTRLMVAREQRKLLEVQRALARQRMAHGSDGGESKSTDRVGAAFKVSGKTVQRTLKVLDAIEAAQSAGQTRKAETLTDLLERGKTGKALDIISGAKKAKEAPKKVEVPKTLLAYVTEADSKFEAACHLAGATAEVEQLRRHLEQMAGYVQAVERRLNGGEGR